MATDNPCLAAALAYASNATRPLFIFPAKPGEKKSRLSKQFSADGKNWGMTNNPETIKKYWQQFPDSNVCIVTGDINGLFVVETDTAAHGKDGAAELDRLIKENGNDWPDTLTAESPSGSKHYYFTWPNADVVILNSDSKLAPGVDVRGEGGMVVAPPSFAPKYNDYYKWVSPPDVGIASAPIWLLKLLCQKPPERNVAEPQASIDKIRTAVELIPNEDSNAKWEVSDYKTGAVNTREGWEGWNTISMALYRATAGSDLGYEIFKSWCAKNKSKFNKNYTHYTWYRRYKRSPPRSLGAGTLFAIAEDHAPGWQKVYDHEHLEETIKAKIEKANANTTSASGAGKTDGGKTEEGTPANKSTTSASGSAGKTEGEKQTSQVDEKESTLGDVDANADTQSTAVPIKTATSPKAEYEIKLTIGNNNNAMETEAYLIAAKSDIYVFGKTLVRPITMKVAAIDNQLTNVAQLVEVTPGYMQLAANDMINYLKYDARAKKWHSVNPPMTVINTLMENSGHWKFPIITGVISTPTLRYDGSIFNQPGYDPTTRLLMVNPPELPAMPRNPTRNDALKALELIEELISEFGFIDEVAKSVALSAILTPIVRGAFQVTPMHVAKASTPGSGKSYLFDVVAAIAIGQRMPAMAAGRNEEETEKRLGAALLVGQTLISIDNVNGELGGEALCQYIERPIVSVRVLGKSENRLVEATGTSMFATGNNITLTGDVTRRALTCTVDLNMEKPEEKIYLNDPVRMVLKDRGKYIAACLTICRAFMLQSEKDAQSEPPTDGAMAQSPEKSAQSEPPARKAPRLGSFEGWSDCVRSALMWLGKADPVESMGLARDEDPKLIALENLMAQWARVMGVGQAFAVPVATVISQCERNGTVGYDQFVTQFPEFHEAVKSVASVFGREPEVKRLAAYLRMNKGRLVNGFKFVNHVPKSGGQAKWWVQKGDNPNAAAVGLREAVTNVKEVKF